METQLWLTDLNPRARWEPTKPTWIPWRTEIFAEQFVFFKLYRRLIYGVFTSTMYLPTPGDTFSTRRFLVTWKEWVAARAKHHRAVDRAVLRRHRVITMLPLSKLFKAAKYLRNSCLVISLKEQQQETLMKQQLNSETAVQRGQKQRASQHRWPLCTSMMFTTSRPGKRSRLEVRQGLLLN